MDGSPLLFDRYTQQTVDQANSSRKNGFGSTLNGEGALFAIARQLYEDTNNSYFLNYPWIAPNAGQNWSGINDDWAKGYEITATGNITPNWRLSVNVGRQFFAPSSFGGIEQQWVTSLPTTMSKATILNT